MEDRIVSSYERYLTTAVDSIEPIESQTVSGRSVIKIFFQPADIVSQILNFGVPASLDALDAGRTLPCTNGQLMLAGHVY